MNDFREVGVLKSFINIQLLDHLLEAYQNGDGAAKSVIDSFADRKGFKPSDVTQCISCKETTLALLAGMIFLVRSHELPPIEEDKHKWWELLELEEEDHGGDVRKKAIAIIRNAIAHWDEQGSGVNFISEATEFSSRAGKLVLKDSGLHLLIMQMYGYTQHITKKGSRTR